MREGREERETRTASLSKPLLLAVRIRRDRKFDISEGGGRSSSMLYVMSREEREGRREREEKEEGVRAL